MGDEIAIDATPLRPPIRKKSLLGLEITSTILELEKH